MVNQALTMNPIFFDPLNKKAEMGEFGKTETIKYVEDACGVRISEDGAVTFTLYAPDADTVEVAGISGSFPSEKIALEKDDGGYFRKRVEGIKAGFHYFNWYIDGIQIRDPQSPFCFGCFEPINFFEIPEMEEDFYFFKDVLHGDVQIRKYVSGVNSHMKTCYVYTPPGYADDATRKYPVLYIQHGVGENETGWIWNGKLNLIMDNLIAEGKCREMLVVMCCGYAFEDGADPVFYPGDFDKELIKDCIPYIERHFRIFTDREHRAMAGLSLGSAQAALTVEKHPELFSYLGVFSGVNPEPVENIMELKENRPELVFLSCGKGETELLRNQENISARMEKDGMRCIQKSYDGFHEWHVWRKSLRDFVMLLFSKDDIPKEIREETAEKMSEERTARAAAYSKEQAVKQLKERSVLFSDPVYKQVIYATDEKGRPAGRYKDIPHGVEITEPGQAVFRIYAPGAKKAEVDIFGMGRFSLEKDTDSSMEGWWIGSQSGISPGFHYHDYYINGTRVVNPLTPLGYGAFRSIGFFEMPEENFKEYIPADVPHGAIHMSYYKSSQTGRYKMCYVYTPPGYDESPDKRFPALYLQHGGGENETGWIWQGKIDHITDNLLADGGMREMIIVMNTGYAFRPDGSSHHSLGSFDEELVNDCIPFIDKHYRTIPDKEHRAMAGLSMGGMQTQKIVFEHPELFAWAGIFSGGLTIRDAEADYSGILLDKEAFGKQFNLLFVACGTEDNFYQMTEENIGKVRDCGIELETFVEHGYHDWTFWRHCIKKFLPLLFRGKHKRNYRNVFAENGISQEQIGQRLQEIRHAFFYEDGEKLYYTVGEDMAYITDTGNNDVRTEGMSYGMMLAVQLDMKEEFDRLWKWAKTYMWMDTGENEGYFAWSCGLDGSRNANGAAPDGEEFFAMALFFASHRWGDGEGIFCYSEEAKEILKACLHKGENGRPGSPMWNRKNHQICFVAGADFTDPSYHLPHFYELFALWADEEDRPFWKQAAAASREYLAKACHPVTGFSAEYAEFDGTPMGRKLPWSDERHDWFYSDSYRTVANIGLDYEWFGTDCGQRAAADNIQKFLIEDARKGTYSIYEVDGRRVGAAALHPVAVTATIAQACLAADNAFTKEWVERFFHLPLRTGERRYYDNCLYFFAFLALSGNYRIW